METVASAELPAGFEEFYQKFHADSLYQISHIAWPLQGETSELVDSIHHRKKLASWEPENWVMHQPVDFSTGDFKRECEMLGKVLVIERIQCVAANYGLERRFALNENNEWELIFYSDMQERR